VRPPAPSGGPIALSRWRSDCEKQRSNPRDDRHVSEVERGPGGWIEEVDDRPGPDAIGEVPECAAGEQPHRHPEPRPAPVDGEVCEQQDESTTRERDNEALSAREQPERNSRVPDSRQLEPEDDLDRVAGLEVCERDLLGDLVEGNDQAREGARERPCLGRTARRPFGRPCRLAFDQPLIAPTITASST
jgi:hypothetical protein